jgi:cytochrome c-type biogenesis protein CcmH/NrfG
VSSQAAALLTVIESDLGEAGADLDPDAAASERREAVKALEKRDIPHALDLAQDAVDHDPGDAESWLVLGAVHLYKNDGKAAQQAFKECAEKAKIGRRDHCLALSGQ